jgi:hypothetical protein
MVFSRNALSPDQLSANERLAEVSHILARGLIRLMTRKSSPLSADSGDSFLDLSPDRSGHAKTTTGKNA